MVVLVINSSRRSIFVGKRIGNGNTSNKNWWLAGLEGELVNDVVVKIKVKK